MASDFLNLGLRPEINAILRENGFTTPTPIQKQTIPLLMAGKDVVAQSQTGTGKTLAFLLPILEKIDVNQHCVQALIITPTRELALQISKEAARLAYKLGIQVLAVYGGHDVDQQIKKLKGYPQIIVGTPGRLLDHLRRKTLQLFRVSKLVLDEADQMLQMGFLEDMEELLRQTPAKRQTMLFSATIPPKIRSLAARYMDRPVHIHIPSQNITLDEIKQIVIELTEQEKLDKLCSLIDEHQPYLAIVFCHTRQRVDMLNAALIQRGYKTDALHGDLSQTKREQILKRFSAARLQILVATDIAARGLDIEGVTHIYNYDIPHDAESYIHRIGRTGRAGETGTAVTFAAPGEHKYLRIIEQGICASIEKFKANGQKVIKRRIQSAAAQRGVTKAGPAVLRTEKRADKQRHAGLNQRSRRKPKTAADAGAQGQYGSSRKSSAAKR